MSNQHKLLMDQGERIFNSLHLYNNGNPADFYELAEIWTKEKHINDICAVNAYCGVVSDGCYELLTVAVSSYDEYHRQKALRFLNSIQTRALNIREQEEFEQSPKYVLFLSGYEIYNDQCLYEKGDHTVFRKAVKCWNNEKYLSDIEAVRVFTTRIDGPPSSLIIAYLDNIKEEACKQSVPLH